MLQTWIYMVVDMSCLVSKDVEYACLPGETDILLFGTYDDASRSVEIRTKRYRQYGYKVKYSGNGTDNDDLIFWSRYENEEGCAHILEIRKKIVYGDLFQQDLP